MQGLLPTPKLPCGEAALLSRPTTAVRLNRSAS
jgi:hypothetical protein